MNTSKFDIIVNNDTFVKNNHPNITWSENSCIIHNTDDTVENFNIFVETYTFIKNNYSLSEFNQFTIFLTPGIYKNPTNVAFELDTDHINVMSLSGERDVIFDLTFVGDPFDIAIGLISEVLFINAECHVKGIEALEYKSISPNFLTNFGTSNYRLPILVRPNNNGAIVENCIGGFGSFGSDLSDSMFEFHNATYIDCESNIAAFGYGCSKVLGKHINCKAITASFGFTQTTNVVSLEGEFINCECIGNNNFGGAFSTFTGSKFINCISGNNSFGGLNSTINSDVYFENCTGGNTCFGGGVGDANCTVSGTFINCKAGNSSFGGGRLGGSTTGRIISYGTFINCEGGSSCFGSSSGETSLLLSEVNGKYENCKAGAFSFGGGQYTIISGTLKNCTADDNSFGGNGDITIGGILENCKAGDNSFGWSNNVTISGTLKNCEAGLNSFCNGNSGNIISGDLYNCVIGSGLNNTDISITGRLFYCHLKSGLFPIVDVGGRTYYCIDGNGDVNNQ